MSNHHVIVYNCPQIKILSSLISRRIQKFKRTTGTNWYKPTYMRYNSIMIYNSFICMVWFELSLKIQINA